MKNAPAPYRNKRLVRPKQRRQQQLLEVSIRASKERAIRVRRIAGIVFKLMLLVGFGVGAWVGGKEALRRFVWENPQFFLTDVRVSTDGTLTRDQILASAGVVEGTNLLELNLAAAQAALDALPQVEHAAVERTLPNRLDIEITERQPIAWVAARGDADPSASERSFLIDHRGFVMKSRKLLPEYLLLPIISGAETENFVPGQKATAMEVQAALELIRLNADSTRWLIRNIDVSKGYCLVVTDQKRAKITFGLERVDRQLVRLNRYLDLIEPTQREILTVNLMVERNTPVTFVEAVAEEPAADSATPPVRSASPESGRSVAATPAARPSSASKTRPAATGKSSPSTKKAAPTPKKDTASAAKKNSSNTLRKPFRE